MTQPAYLAARRAASRIHPHFVAHEMSATGRLGSVPDMATIERMIDVAFWTSLRREESYTPLVSLAYASPGQVDSPLVLQNPVPFAPQPLTRLGPAVERPGIHLGVWPVGGVLQVWGATRTLPAWCFVLEVVAPGLLVIKHSRSDASGKFVNVAVLQGDEIKILDPSAARTADCPSLITSLLGLETPPEASGSANVLIQMAVSMRAHGRGGALLVVPSDGNAAWRESILHPVLYAVAPAYSALATLMREPGQRPRQWQERLQRTVDGIAGLTAVDGATVITDRYDLLAFGAKIVRRVGQSRVPQVVLTEPAEGTSPRHVEPSQLGGTRHLSAAQFAHDQHDSIALVASQDGRFTVFAWSACENTVHAHRIEALLL